MVLKFSFAHFNISETTRHLLSVKLGKQIMCGEFILIKNITFLYVLYLSLTTKCNVLHTSKEALTLNLLLFWENLLSINILISNINKST